MADDEKLILLVQERSEIYNKYNPLFKFPEKKREAWVEIAEEIGTTEDDCSRRWTSLRDRFTRECKKSEQSNEPVVWPYFEMMEFLRPFIATRPIRRSAFSKSKVPSTLRNRTPPPSPLPIKTATPSPPASPTATPVDCREFTQILEDPLIETPLPRKTNTTNIFNTANTNREVDKSFCEAVEALKKACALNEARHANPAVYAFGEMIVSTICSMNSRNQLKAMQQVTDTVMKIKLEEDELLEQMSY